MPNTSFPFGKEVKSYRQLAIVTPYQNSVDLFDRPLGRYVQKAQQWRMAFFTINLILMCMVAIFIALLFRNPYTIMTLQVTESGFLKSPPQLLTDRHEVRGNNIADILQEVLGSSNSVIVKALDQGMHGHRSFQQILENGERIDFTDFVVSPNENGGDFSAILSPRGNFGGAYKLTGTFEFHQVNEHSAEKTAIIREINITKVNQ